MLRRPALSKQVQALERELGVDLLVRLPGGVRPTPAGTRLDELSRALLVQVDNIRSAVREAAASLAGTVTLGLSPSLVPALAGHLERRFAQEHPQARLAIVEALPMFLAERVEEGRLDLGVFTTSPDQATPELSVVGVGTDEMLLVGRPDLLAGTDGPATADVLRTLRLVLPPGFREVLQLSGPQMERATQDTATRSTPSTWSATWSCGCALLGTAYTFVRGDLERGTIAVAGFEPPIERQLVAATRAGRQPSPA
ncbi:LysR family transcriptional regulator, partial [Pseudonocardia sp. KRD-188]